MSFLQILLVSMTTAAIVGSIIGYLIARRENKR